MPAITRRRPYFIVDRSLQYRLLALVIIYTATVVVFLGICLFVPDILDMLNEDLGLEVRAAAAERLLSIHARVWPAIIALVCLFGIHSIRISNRLFGPLYRLRWAFGNICKGDLSFRMTFRKGDYLHREEAAVNDMIALLAKKWRTVQTTALDALRSLDTLERAVADVSGSPDDKVRMLEEHRRHLELLAQCVRYFRLKEEVDSKAGIR
jgi:methyl-accepting chemotaxis protein